MGASGSLPLAGVQLIVDQLGQFEGDIKKTNSIIDSLKPRSTMLQNAFSSAWDMVKGFGREVLNVAEYALGHLLSDAIEFVVTKIGELVTSTIEAGMEFQALELRLKRLNFNALIESGASYKVAGYEAVKATKEQLEWLQKLAATTPYDNADISRVYTLARSYGFADQRARGLTDDIVNFASGMGLGNTEIERIIVNFGQMVQQGKVTQRELNDLARGSFVPVNDIIARMAQNTGKTGKAMDDFRKTGKSVNAFMQAFSEIVEERFTGAAEDMAKTLKAASDNAQDVVKSIGGLHIVKPILDAIGSRIAAFTSAFTDNPQRWDRMVAAAKRIGSEISRIIDRLFGLLPSSESLADAAVSAVEGMADWLDEHGFEITNFFKNLGEIVGGVVDNIRKVFSSSKKPDNLEPGAAQQPAGTAPKEAPFGQGILNVAQKIADFINNTLVPALQGFSDWVTENRPLIDEFWTTLGEIVGTVIENLTGTKIEGGGFMDMVKQFMVFVIENKDAIAKWVTIILKLIIAWQILATVWGIVVGILLLVIGKILAVVGVISLLWTIGGLLIPLFSGIATGIGLFLAALATIIPIALGVVGVWLLLRNNAELLKRVVGIVLDTMKRDWEKFKQNMKQIAEDIYKSWRGNGNWQAMGKAVIDGIKRGIENGWESLKTMVSEVAQSVYQAAMDALNAKSPSRLFMYVGEMTMAGFAKGIEKYAGLATEAVRDAMTATVPAAAATNSYATTNNFNLAIHSSARAEPIIQDFEMMRSMV